MTERNPCFWSVVSGSPADSADLRQLDVIIKLGDADISTSQQLRSTIESHSPGDKVTITFKRGQTTMTAKVTLSQKPSG